MNADVLQKKFGEVVRKRRTALNFSQESFAEAVGVHRTYMGAIERGEQNVALKNLLKIANALATPLSVLLAEAETAC